MTDTTLAAEFNYDPDRLLDTLIKKLNLKNDAALSRSLEVAPPVISKIRHRRLPVSASILIRMHEVSELSIRELCELMGPVAASSELALNSSNQRDSPHTIEQKFLSGNNGSTSLLL